MSDFGELTTGTSDSDRKGPFEDTGRSGECDSHPASWDIFEGLWGNTSWIHGVLSREHVL